MPDNRIRKGWQMSCRQSDDRIVLKKEGNASGGKAVTQSHIKREIQLRGLMLSEKERAVSDQV